MEETISWKDERQEAIRLMQALENRKKLNISSRRWLLTRWPEVQSLDCGGAEKLLLESQLRDAQGHSLQEVLLLVQRSLEELYIGKSEYEASKHVTFLRTLSDSQLERAIPYALASFNMTTLHSLSFIISGRSRRKSKNRIWLERKLRAELMAMDGKKLSGLILKASSIIRNPKSGRKCLSSAFLLEGPSEAVQQALPVKEAIQEALQQLDMMSHRSLLVMNDILSKNPSKKITGLVHKLGNDKRNLASVVKRKLQSILNKMKNESIPTNLQKALRVMNLSAREEHGCDGNLSKYLGPVPAELEMLHRRLLSGLSLTKNLNFHQLESIYITISGESKRIFKKEHPWFYVRTIQIILREVLYKCDSNNVPEHVLKAVEMIHRDAELDPEFGFQAVKEMPHKEAKVNPNPEHSGENKRRRLNEQRSGVELEALLNISSCLRQVLWECYENYVFYKIPFAYLAKHHAAQTQISGPPESLDHHAISFKVESKLGDQYNVTGIEPKYEECNGDSDIGHLNNVGITVVAREGDAGDFSKPSASKIVENFCSEDELPEREDDLAKKFESIADQGSALVYVIIGRAMEEAFRRQGGYLPKNIRRYLQSGLSNSKKDPEENIGAFENFGECCEEDELIVSVAEKLPFISNRALARVKARLSSI